MTKAEQRAKAFSYGMKKLSSHSRNYIQTLTHVLFIAEQPALFPVPEEKYFEKGGKRRNDL